MNQDSKSEKIRKIFEAIFASQNNLRDLAPEFKWSGLGNLLGDYGEFIAIQEYNLVKAPSGSGDFDAIAKSGKTVQIKANFSAKQIGFRGEADLLLVISIQDSGSFDEIYYGSFEKIKKIANYSTRDNKWMISVKKLKTMNSEIKLGSGN
jgi:hypothetical protein